MTPLHHHAIQANLSELLPTQGAFGYVEVSQKRAEWQRLSHKLPYRSLAGLARKAGAFAKDVTPFSEFLWADYFRSRIKKQQLQQSMDDAVASALALARHPEASYLPGFVQA